MWRLMNQGKQEYEDCYISFDGTMLVAGNGKIERRWKTENGFPVSLSLLDKKTGTEWLAAEGGVPYMAGADPADRSSLLLLLGEKGST
ncbi:hypothetical protein FE784_15535 [Paenibacillus hemerocallicola]|uniref:Uncharacterized protein n=1 Tax=Paenibacillus hemerocallicola TaxID=1172614 RepID=A0A5C4TAI0_9BACL|nr:hypothetical protein [Paenibacillus hemerocallicola]TNJ65429.1 hypothetical protein FE784_15535 [Paenibacillus hemerocallicola]